MRLKINNHQVIKIGSQCLFDDRGETNLRLLKRKAEEIKGLEERLGRRSTLVVSGAIALGKRQYGDARRNEDISATELQRYACKGQIELMDVYKTIFDGIYGVSQLLLTSENFRRPADRKHIRDLIAGDCGNNTLTLVNYNDGVDFEQLRKDNEQTSATLALYCGSERLIILGLYEGFIDRQGNLIAHLSRVSQQHYAMCNGNSENGTGGFKAKLRIVNNLIDHGTKVIIAHVKHPLEEVIQGKYGTHFG